jgi:site-specific DNA recombinase
VQVDVGQQRRDYRTLTSSYVTCVDDPIVQDTCLQPFSDEANDTSVADPVLQETDEPLVINRVKEAPNVGIQDVVHFLSRDSNDQRVQRIMLAAFRTEPIENPRKSAS